MLNHMAYFTSWDYRHNDYDISKNFALDLFKYRMEDVNEN